MLPALKSTAELKSMSFDQLLTICDEVREKIIEVVSVNGGHLASSLGVVELTVALHRVLDTPKDRIVWDVGHQAYAHKLLTGRFDQFHTLRQLDGISGFPKRKESAYDCFDVGHSSTSISGALGMAAARDARGTDEKIFAVIGDGSLTAGMAFEGLNQAGHLNKDMVVILNDNEMSISPNVGALSSFLSRQMTSDFFVRMKRETENFLDHVPKIGKDLRRLAKRVEESVKGFLTPGMLFEAFGFDYVGPIEGHKLDEVIQTLENVTKMDGPILVHIVTRKGQGFEPAIQSPSKFHGVGPFNRESGEIKSTKGGVPTYTSVFGETLCNLAVKDDRIVAITAAMLEGTGLKKFAAELPDRFFDVGIAEQHAVTFAAGLATQGLKPVCAIYSTFLQRAYDSVLHDVCLQNLPVTFAIDRGGLVGADGPTHHGTFDVSFLRSIPNLVFAAPRDEAELQRIMVTALDFDGPFAYRYPRGSGVGVELADKPQSLKIGEGELLCAGDAATLVAIGSSVQEALGAAAQLKSEGIEVAVVDARFIKPLDEVLLLAQAEKTGLVFTIEESVRQGGFGSAVLELLEDKGCSARVERIGLPDVFVEQGSQPELRSRHGIDAEGIIARVKALCAVTENKAS
ncbi:MAG: 1-deoxy-D-xylulose-5-phosphate synthase [Desulfuromonas sp.]|nr:MAG: 1-deoxy-D-xylulose-5-phosphate synthase [Desulfuromonas sp.]